MTKLLSVLKANFEMSNRFKECVVVIVLSINSHFKRTYSLMLKFQKASVSWPNASPLRKAARSSGNFCPFCAWQFLESERVFPTSWTSADAWGQFFCEILCWSSFEVYHNISEVKPKLRMLPVRDTAYFVLCRYPKSITPCTNLEVCWHNLWQSCI